MSGGTREGRMIHEQHIDSTMASSMFQLGYGYTLQGDQDPFFLRAQSAIDQVTEAGMFTSESI